MPQSKLGFYRYILIDRMLRNKQHTYPTMDDILNACFEKFGVRSISTIEKDFAAMRTEFDAPIAYSKKHRGYYYTDPTFKLMGLSLEDKHVMALDFAETVLEGMHYIPFFNEFSDAVDKVLDGLEMRKSFSKDQRKFKSWIQFEQPGYNRGSETLSALVRHIADGQPISLSYRKFGATQPKDYLLHPYLIKEDNGYWYLIGYVQQYEQIRTFGIDRIEHYHLSPEVFIPPTEVDFDGEAYFRHCFGVTVMDGQPEEIILAFTPHQGHYLKTQPIHHSQEILEDSDTAFRIRLHLINNFELRTKILSYGTAVEVLSPASLRQQITQELAQALGKYQSH